MSLLLQFNFMIINSEIEELSDTVTLKSAETNPQSLHKKAHTQIKSRYYWLWLTSRVVTEASKEPPYLTPKFQIGVMYASCLNCRQGQPISYNHTQ